MPRIALSEFRAKNLVYKALEIEYTGLSIDLESTDYRKTVKDLDNDGLYVAKVDQAIKKRNQNGLVTVKRSKAQLLQDLDSFASQGFRYAIVEPFIAHAPKDEHYVSLARTEKGVVLQYSKQGGVAIESHADTLEQAILDETGFDASQNTTKLDDNFAQKLYELFQKAHMTLLEINPCVIKENHCVPLDAAVEVDSAALFFVDSTWSESDTRHPKTYMSKPEKEVEKLNAKSPASFSLKTLNPDGSFFLLLSGGGASVVVADELSQLGHHDKMANYGEYSGNPTEEETCIYAGEVFKLLFDSKAKQKVLLIAGGVANFTDVAKTFAGIIHSMKDYSEKFVEQKIRVMIRRGGPNQDKGLKAIKNFLEALGIDHEVYGPDVTLAETVGRAVEGIQ